MFVVFTIDVDNVSDDSLDVPMKFIENPCFCFVKLIYLYVKAIRSQN